MNHIFLEITVVVVLATLLGAAARAFRQPTILGYLAAGILIGPLGLLRLNNIEVIDAFAQVGITLLLFLVGMELRLKDIREIGKPAALTGIGQIVFTSGFGYLIARALGYGSVPALYLAVALTFSSTIIVVKLLAEKQTLDSLYGRIVVGFLLVQDFVALFMLILIAGAGANGGDGALAATVFSLAKAVALFGAALLAGKFVVPKMLSLVSGSQEMLFLTSLAWGLGIAAAVAVPPIGFSIEIGGFLAGIALADSVQHYQISSRIKSLRDFFIVMFFIVLGSKMALGNLQDIWADTLIFSAFVLIGNPIIVMLVMGLLGYRSRTSFLASVTVAQISEFSMIVIALAHRMGHVDARVVSLVTAVGIVTITLSSYMIIYDEKIYGLLRDVLRVFELRTHEEPALPGEARKGHTVLIGAHRLGHNILDSLAAAKKTFTVVDFNPEVVQGLLKQGIHAVYGDISDPEIQEAAGMARARLVISTVPSHEETLGVLRYLRKRNPKAKAIVTGHAEHDAEIFYAEGADYVMLPHFIGGLQIAQTISRDRSLRSLRAMRKHDMAIIEGRS